MVDGRRGMLSWAKPGDAEGEYMSQGGDGVPSFPALVFTNTGDADVVSYHACRYLRNPVEIGSAKSSRNCRLPKEKAKEK